MEVTSAGYSSCIPHHESASTQTVYDEQSDQSSEVIFCAQDTSKQPGECWVEAKRVFKNHSRIYDD